MQPGECCGSNLKPSGGLIALETETVSETDDFTFIEIRSVAWSGSSRTKYLGGTPVKIRENERPFRHRR